MKASEPRSHGSTEQMRLKNLTGEKQKLIQQVSGNMTSPYFSGINF
jgi:hypothetical protein